jgi:sporulation protein YlmC with PRC-barrel domain
MAEWQLDDMKDTRVLTKDGREAGRVEAIYLDDTTGDPEWALVGTGWFGHRATFVPLRNARLEEGKVVVPYDEDTLRGAPTIEPDGDLSHSEEADLYSYYALLHGEDRPGLRIRRHYDVFPNRKLWGDLSPRIERP